MALIEAGKNETEAKAFAVKFSSENPGTYCTLVADFGQAFLVPGKSLHTFAPTDSLFGSYWLNGNEKKFTTRQKSADSEATPVLS